MSVHGKYARVTWDTNSIPNLQGWTCTLAQANADDSVMAAANHGRTRKAGFRSGTGTVTAWMTTAAFHDGTAAMTDGQSAVLQLKRGAQDGAGGYNGTAQLLSRAASNPKDGIVLVTYNFKYNGAVSPTLS